VAKYRSVLYKFLLTYFCICAATLLVCFPIYYKALDVSKENIVSEQRHTLASSAQNFEKNLQQLLSLHTIFSSNYDYQELRLYSSPEFPGEKSIKMQAVQRQFGKMVAANPLLSGGFLYFSRNQLIISNNQILQNREIAFTSFLRYSDLSPEALQAGLEAAPIGISFLPPSDLLMTKSTAGDCFLDAAVTVVTRSAGSSAYICGIISREKIRELFHLTNNPSHVFCIISNGDTVVFEQNAADGMPQALLPREEGIDDVRWKGQTYTAMTVDLPMINSQAVLAIPEQYFQDSIRPVRQMIVFYIFCATVFGGIISIFFARYSYAPVRRIVRSNGIDLNSMTRKSNEYACIENTLQHYNVSNQVLTAQIQDMEETLQVNLYIRLLAGSVFTQSDRLFCAEKLPLAAGRYRVALFFCPDGEEQPEEPLEDPYALLLSASLLHHMYGMYLLGQIDRQSTAVLFSCERDGEKLFAELAATVQQNFRLLCRSGVEVGVSSEFQGVENVRTAYEQARFSLTFAVATTGQDPVIHYYQQAAAPENKMVDFTALQQLYELILAGETDAIAALFGRVENNLSENGGIPEMVQETYTVLCYVVHNVLIDQRLHKEDYLLPDPGSGRPVRVLFRELLNVCMQICQTLKERRQSNNQGLKERLLTYIQQHFSDNTLYADTIARELNISEKYVYKLIREHTGQTLNEYVEQLRIQHAMELIKKTELPVAAIAAASGFNAVNTFYRVFKKYYSAAPSAYRGQDMRQQ
jgi:AraC-like DNA-binding protein